MRLMVALTTNTSATIPSLYSFSIVNGKRVKSPFSFFFTFVKQETRVFKSIQKGHYCGVDFIIKL